MDAIERLSGAQLAEVYGRVISPEQPIPLPPFADLEFGRRRVRNALEQYGARVVLSRGRVTILAAKPKSTQT